MAPETCIYYGTFAPGLEGTVAEILGERFPGIAIPLRLSGALAFKSPVSYDRLNLPCFNNVFRLIDTAADMNSAENSRPEQTLTAFARRTLGWGAERLVFSGPGREPESKKAQGRAAGFRVIFSLENKLVAVDEELRRMAENRLAALSGLRVNRGRPGVEFWFLLRREGAFFLQRLSRHRPWDKLLHPGELPPPLAWMLCRLSNPGPGQRVADPFCGYGSIPAARLRHFPPAEFFASDMDKGVLKIAQAKFQGKPQHRCHFACIDAGELPRLIPPASLDSIITDPPWGLYQ
ncbi:MAG: hypothetical protein LBG07_07850, partial [Treponema sp.]|nr:hypothetical protein [Treponema sp.]